MLKQQSGKENREPQERDKTVHRHTRHSHMHTHSHARTHARICRQVRGTLLSHLVVLGEDHLCFWPEHRAQCPHIRHIRLRDKGGAVAVVLVRCCGALMFALKVTCGHSKRERKPGGRGALTFSFAMFHLAPAPFVSATSLLSSSSSIERWCRIKDDTTRSHSGFWHQHVR